MEKLKGQSNFEILILKAHFSPGNLKLLHFPESERFQWKCVESGMEEQEVLMALLRPLTVGLNGTAIYGKPAMSKISIVNLQQKRAFH